LGFIKNFWEDFKAIMFILSICFPILVKFHMECFKYVIYTILCLLLCVHQIRDKIHVYIIHMLSYPYSISYLYHIVTIKVYIFVCILFNKILPIKDNWVRRGVLRQGTLLCLGGWEKEELVNHLFM